MNFEPTEEQEMLRGTFARFLDEHSTPARVRAALPSGFDLKLWQGLAELGVFALRVPQDAGGTELGLFDAALLMEEAGRTLLSGPLAETLVAAGLLGRLGAERGASALDMLLKGESVVGIALHDVAAKPTQWVAGGRVASTVVARTGSDIVLIDVPSDAQKPEENLASTPLAELDLGTLRRTTLATGPEAMALFAAALEEWKLLTAAALVGLGREALKLAAAYSCERKQFGQPIGMFQAISHPLADLFSDIDGAKLLIWKAIRDIHDGSKEAGPCISLALWSASDSSARAVTQSLHSFGGYGLTTEYDIHLFNLRAKAWPLVLGDPRQLLKEAGRRYYGAEEVSLPSAGQVPVEFGLGPEAQAIAEEIHVLFDQHVTTEMRAKFHYSWEGHVPEVHRMLAAAKLLFVGLPVELSGRKLQGYARIAATSALEDEGYTTFAVLVTAMVALMIHRFGTEALKAEVLSKILSGEAICSLGYSEPSSGSDVFAAQCRATRDGDLWRIDGTKMFTSGADLASYVLMLCRTNPEVPKHKGLTMFVVPLKAQGVTIQPVYTFQDERTNITFFDGVRVPDAWRLGDVDGGARTMGAALDLEHGATFNKYQLAMVKAAASLCSEIVDEGHELIESADCQMRLASALAHAWSAKMLAYRAQWAGVEKKSNLAYGPIAKLFSSEKFQSDARDLLDLTAPLSLSKRAGPAAFVNQCYRHAHGTTIYAGTSEIHRSMIAERCLGLPRTRA